MESKETPLDEICFSLPPAVEHFRGIRPDNIHLYFLSSPFCDPTSNNKQVEFQNNRHPEGWRILADRDSFEDRVKKISSGGIDYFVEGSKVSAPDANPVWVIRKQQRDIVGGTSQTKLTGTYFAFGERVYQAPSIADLVSSRLAYTSTLLNDFFKEAADMQFYTPATGYSYFPPVQKPATTSGIDSARQSRAGSPVVDSAQPSQAHSKAESESTVVALSSLGDDSMLLASFQATVIYQDEYIDENPLQGEPGSFVFAHSNSQIQSQKEKEKSSQQQSQERLLGVSAPGSSRGASSAPTPLPPIKTEGIGPQRKGSKAASPISASAISPGQSANPYKTQKARRKSKAATPGGSGGA